jgi:energy-coupling factor transporter ATP-binding protein EcfA2
MAKTSKPEAAPAPQPPYIKRAHLRNVPPLRDVKVDFKPGLNIIIGKNGSGKTNFMKLLSELVERHKEKYKGAGCELIFGDKKDVKVQFNEQKHQVGNVKQSPLTRANNVHLPLLIVATNGDATREADVLDEATYTLLSDDIGYGLVNIWHGLPSNRLPIIDLGTDVVLSSNGPVTLSNFGDNWWDIGSELVRGILNNIDELAYDEKSLKNINSSISLDLVRQRVMQAVDIYLEQFNLYLPIYTPLQAVRRSDQFQVYRNTSNDELLIKGLVLEYQIQGDWLPFSALSDGTKRVFFLIAEILIKQFVSWNAEKTSFEVFEGDKIIFLEEPELGIHPDQLQLLLQLIREVSKEHQVIMTTHSPQTLDMLRVQELDRITICEFIPGKGTQMRKLSPAKKAKAKAYLRDSGFLSEFWRFSNLEDPD